VSGVGWFAGGVLFSERVRKIAGHGFGAGFLFESGFGDEGFEKFFVFEAGEGQVHGLAGEVRHEDGITQLNGADTFRGGGEEFFAIEDGIGEIFEDASVLFAVVSGGGDLDFPNFWSAKMASGGGAEFGHGDDVTAVVEFVIFEDEFAAFASNFEAVSAGSFSGGGDEDAGGAVFVLEVSGDIIFYFDVVVATDFAEATDFIGQAEDPLEEIEVVGALIEKHAAAFSAPGSAPSAGGVIVFGAEPIGDNPVDATDGAEFSSLNQFPHFLVVGVGALVEHGSENLFFIFVGGDEAFAVSLMDGEGLFHKDVEALLESVDADGGVIVVRGGDEDGIDFPGADHFCGTGEVFELGVFGQFGGIEIADGGEFGSGHFLGEEVSGVNFTHVAEADDAEADSFRWGRFFLGRHRFYEGGG
jgi:hypothetical protein